MPVAARSLLSSIHLLTSATSLLDTRCLRGIEVGDRVAVWAPNCAEWVVTMFAAARAGLILVTINPAYRLSELEFALAKVGCEAIVAAVPVTVRVVVLGISDRLR